MSDLIVGADVVQMVKEIRIKTGWTQSHLAWFTGVSLSTIVRYENGTASPNNLITWALSYTHQLAQANLLQAHGDQKLKDTWPALKETL
jgi:DNA-binding XRE family transcriptional regulator